jgi:hypothetical protein
MKDHKDKKEEWEKINSMSIEDMWKQDLQHFSKEYHVYKESRERNNSSAETKKSSAEKKKALKNKN